MRKHFIIIALLSFSFVLRIEAQEEPKFDTGIGVGLDYGGIGANVNFILSENITIEGFCGYNLLDIAGGGAVNIYLLPKESSRIYRLAVKTMYGYNAIINQSYDADINFSYNHAKIFYGFTFGLVNEFRFGKRKDNGFNIGILVPIRTKEFYTDFKDLEDSGYEVSKPWPVLFSIGYRVEFRK